MTDPVTPPLGPSIGANPSFVDLLVASNPSAFPAPAPSASPLDPVRHGTTVLGLKYDGGIVMAGDRQATAGMDIADDRIEKVFAADDYSAIAISGSAGQAVEIVKLFQLELEHYEKITGDRLSLEGKANRLAQMIRGNLPLAMQAGLIVVPLFGGFDEGRGQGRIFNYDATGGRWEDEDFHATGSGGRAARSSLRKRWRPGMDLAGGLAVAVEALVDASREDAATGGPDPSRAIYPTVVVVDASGARRVEESRVAETVAAVLGGGA
ncbi:MAG: proteasome subunit beta [Actinomycetota bacterium]